MKSHAGTPSAHSLRHRLRGYTSTCILQAPCSIYLFFHKFFVSFTFFLHMENEGLKEGARPRIQKHPPKMGDRRWEERVAGAESGSKYDRMMWESGVQRFPPVGPFWNSVLTKYFSASNRVSWCKNGACLCPQPTKGPSCCAPISVNCGTGFWPIAGCKSTHNPPKLLTI